MPIEHTLKMPSEAEINAELREMGKYRKEDELNCGSCGYNTCREKAIAVLQGKAEISMCLPYLKDKAESFSDCIVNNTPNGLVRAERKSGSAADQRRRTEDYELAFRVGCPRRARSADSGSRGISARFCRQNATSATKESTLRNTKNMLKQTVVYDADVSPSHLHNARRYRRGNRARKERKHLAARQSKSPTRSSTSRCASYRKSRRFSARPRQKPKIALDETEGVNRQ